MQTAFTVMGVGYLAGGVLFGLALFRARDIGATLLSLNAVEADRS